MKPSGIFRHVAIGWIALTTSAVGAFALQITLTDVDGSTSAGELVSLTPSTLVWQVDGEQNRTPLADLSKISFHTRQSTSQTPQPCVLYPRGGGQIAGSILEPMTDGVVVMSRVTGKLKVPFDKLRAIAIEQHSWPIEVQMRFAEAIKNPVTGEDVLLAKSDKAASGVRAIHGAIVEFGPSGGEFRFNNRTRRIRLEKVFALILAAPLQEAPSYPAKIHLTNGDELIGTLTSIEDDTVSLMTSLDQEVSCTIGDLQTLALNNDRIVYLDTLAPHSHSSSGIIHDGWAYRTNRNVFNQPMRLDSTVFDHGIGVHAHSEIRYRLAGKYETFAATIGLDDAVRPGGKVRFKVITDGKVAFDSDMMTGLDRAKPIAVSIVGSEWMTLIVETSEGADIGDWANWGAARLIKPKTQS